MVNTTLIWFLLLPIFGAMAVWYLTGKTRDSIIAAGIFAFVSILAIVIAFAASHGVKTADTEIWNGMVTSKARDHGTYEKPYDCMCRSETTCSGTGAQRSCSTRQVCQTCYETRYTVNWNCQTTVGRFTIDSRDSSSRSVYNEGNPQRWSIINAGDPVSKTNTYTNYVQAVPESLFRPSNSELKKKFAPLIPAYPSNVYDFYRVNRFLTPGYNSPDAPAWNESIGQLLKERGPRKQVNVVVVVAKTDDPNYAYALQDAWVGAKKNDVVLVVGSANWPKIDFVEVISWTKNELFKVQTRDEVLALGTVQRQPVMDILAKQIDTNFERRRMREFKYLEAEIDPPGWLLGILAALIAGGGALTIFLKNGKSFTYIRPSYNRYR